MKIVDRCDGEKPAKLTVADLKPGDVFIYFGVVYMKIVSITNDKHVSLDMVRLDSAEVFRADMNVRITPLPNAKLVTGI